MSTKLTTTIADCLEELDGHDYESIAETLIDYLAERGYAIIDTLPIDTTKGGNK